ncbi:MAG: hypothetical protein WA373_07305 [Burkholderiales bacterium]
MSPLKPKIIRELRLSIHGLKIVERPCVNFTPLPDGDWFRPGPTPTDVRRELE